MRRIYTGLIFLTAALLTLPLLSGCGEEHDAVDEGTAQTNEQAYTIHTEIDEEGNPFVTLEDGQVYTDMELYTADMTPFFEYLAEENIAVNFTFGENMQATMDTHQSIDDVVEDSPIETREQPLRAYLGRGYFLSTGWGNKYVSGCIRKNVRRLAIRLNRYSSQVFDMHAAFYTKNGRVCFGLYESVSNWQRCICSPTYNEVKQTVLSAALAAGVSYAVAVVIAEIVTPVLMIGAVAL